MQDRFVFQYKEFPRIDSVHNSHSFMRWKSRKAVEMEPEEVNNNDVVEIAPQV